jgi:hypothetical protein
MRFSLIDLLIGVLFVGLVAGATRYAANANSPWTFALVLSAIAVGVMLLGRVRRRNNPPNL